MTLSLEDWELESREFILFALEDGAFGRVDVWSPDQKRRQEQTPSQTLEQAREEREPAIVIACGDLTQLRDRLTHCWNAVTPLSHLVSLNGGGLRLDGCHPANRGNINYVAVYTDQVTETRDILHRKLGKPVNKVIVYVDFPCGVARNHRTTARGSCRSAINGKKFLKDTFPNLEVALKFYLGDPINVLGREHPLILKNPKAVGLTLYFSSEKMLECIKKFDEQRVSAA